MHRAPACPPDDYLEAIALARLILPTDVHLQAPPTSPMTSGACWPPASTTGGRLAGDGRSRQPERPWPALERLRSVTEAAGFTLARASPSIPSTRWRRPGGSTRPCASPCRTAATPRASVASRGRSGTRAPRWSPPPCSPRRRGPVGHRGGRCGVRSPKSWPAWAAGHDVGVEEIVTLFSARGPEVAAVAEVADDLRRDAVGDVVTFVSTATSTTPTCAPSSAGSAPSRRVHSASTCGARPTAGPGRDLHPGGRGRSHGRHRGLPPGRHPPQLRR